MKPTIFLRIASVLTLIHSILHTVGGVFGKPAPAAAAVLAAMQSTRFQVLGVTRTYSDFYTGMGLGVTIFLTVEAVVFWLLASLVKADGSRLRPILAVFMIGYLVFAANSYVFFFVGPIIGEVLIALCLGLAIMTAKLGVAEHREAARAN